MRASVNIRRTSCRVLDERNMNETHSRWLTKELSEIFSEGVRGAIPGANFQLEIITKLISVWSPSPATILDLGCGDGILDRMLLAKYPAAHTVFEDFSEPMLGKVRQKVGDNKMATVIQIDFATPDWTDAVEAQTPFDIVVSGFAIHHQPDDRKRALYTEIYNLLKEGGIFLNLDQVCSETSVISEIFDSFFLENIQGQLRPTPIWKVFAGYIVYTDFNLWKLIRLEAPILRSSRVETPNRRFAVH